MKKILSCILPSLFIFAFIYIDSMFPDSKYILLGIYLLFPITFIVQGIVSSNLRSYMVLGFLLSSLTVILFCAIFYNMSSMISPVIIYLIFGAASVFLTISIKGKLKKEI